jgi:hypothetical protein
LIIEKQFCALNCQSLTWPAAYDKRSQLVDALPAIVKKRQDKNLPLFQALYYYKRVIVTRDTDTRISGIEELEGLPLAVQRIFRTTAI